MGSQGRSKQHDPLLCTWAVESAHLRGKETDSLTGRRMEALGPIRKADPPLSLSSVDMDQEASALTGDFVDLGDRKAVSVKRND